MMIRIKGKLLDISLASLPIEKTITMKRKVPPYKAVIGCVPMHRVRKIPKKTALLIFSLFKFDHRNRKK
jgi:hypothetical protein|tara:strand:+ start:869 stop:1075 length:207 start_codon:yes stop_codon:yes gene_type:complete